MNTTRRGFLGLLTGLVATPVLQPLMKLLPTATSTYIQGKEAVIGQYADYTNISDIIVDQAIDPAISYNVRFCMGSLPSAVMRIRNIKVPDDKN